MVILLCCVFIAHYCILLDVCVISTDCTTNLRLGIIKTSLILQSQLILLSSTRCLCLCLAKCVVYMDVDI